MNETWQESWNLVSDHRDPRQVIEQLKNRSFAFVFAFNISIY